jgi:acylphosphatase
MPRHSSPRSEGEVSSKRAALQATVHGRVQGVYFRRFAVLRARELGLAGYARNLPDGTVEVRAEGDADRLQELLSYLEEGPPGARVDGVTTNWSQYTGSFTGFGIRY